MYAFYSLLSEAIKSEDDKCLQNGYGYSCNHVTFYVNFGYTFIVNH